MRPCVSVSLEQAQQELKKNSASKPCCSGTPPCIAASGAKSMMSPLARLPIKVACKAGLASRLLRPMSGPPVILMYHGVSNESREGLLDRDGKHIDQHLFRDHLKLLSKRRKVVPLAVLTKALADGEDARGMVAITFDDGYLDNIECAAPVL